LLLTYSSIRSLIICKYRDSNMSGNHFRFLNARIVQRVESVWTVLYIVVVDPPFLLYKKEWGKEGKETFLILHHWTKSFSSKAKNLIDVHSVHKQFSVAHRKRSPPSPLGMWIQNGGGIDKKMREKWVAL